MFKLSSSKEIGTYLHKLIEINFKSNRQFSKQCVILSNVEPADSSINNMSNRLSQILNGNKSIQIEDLPIFSKLLNVSCEEILSAGKNFSPSSNHLTNYSVAFSKEESIWEEYISHDDALILNADEYGKTVIDYALEFKNIEFMKYLLQNNYIWFVGTEEKTYYCNFGAGTKIKRHSTEQLNMNILDSRLKMNYDLRMNMIMLAIENNDVEILENMRAREIPSLYNANFLGRNHPDFKEYEHENFSVAIANSNNFDMIKYFCEEFEIKSFTGKTNSFMFPYFNELLDLLIQNNSEYAELALKNAIKHNENTYEKLKELLKTTVDYYTELGSTSETITKICTKDYLSTDKNIISYRFPITGKGVITNLIQAISPSSDTKITYLIGILNELHAKILNIKPQIK